jgi:nitroimidazol reductase NimA-like FMN-containing flavoprotein (pyridoxamine 5'-phosphate oxidase superfamily)
MGDESIGNALRDRLKEVQAMLGEINHGVLATVSADGQPHSTPLFMVRDTQGFYWASDPSSQHSRNIANTQVPFL